MWSRYGGDGRVGRSPYRDPPPTRPPNHRGINLLYSATYEREQDT